MVSVKGTGVGYYLIIVLLSFVLSCPLPLFSSDWSIIAGVSLFLFSVSAPFNYELLVHKNCADMKNYLLSQYVIIILWISLERGECFNLNHSWSVYPTLCIIVLLSLLIIHLRQIPQKMNKTSFNGFFLKIEKIKITIRFSHYSNHGWYSVYKYEAKNVPLINNFFAKTIINAFYKSYWSAILNFPVITVCSICETMHVKKKIHNDELIELCKRCQELSRIPLRKEEILC